ncbi:MAG: efflux RND transporter periplasmic adaptor subunit [Myxococcota bacterium]|nr:efflux RND transporter periplasmic adaptor subunit [Myxococcota bacterium]
MRRAALFALLIHGCQAQSDAPPPPEARSTPVIETFSLAVASVEMTVSLPGELSPYEAVDIRARVSGLISALSVDRGSKVRKDDVLLRLRAPELSAQRAEAQARSRTQESTLKRLEEAAQTPGAVATNEVDIARTTLEAERARTASLEALESYTSIRAPFAGIVTKRYVHPGALVSPTDRDPLLRLEDVSRLRLTVAVPEHASGSLTLGESVPFTVAAYPGERFMGVIQRSAGSIDTTTRTLPVELDVANADNRLAPGSYAQVAWPVRHERTFMVPRTALVQTATRLFVICVREGKAARVEVRRGLTRGDDVEIFGEVREGDRLIKRASEDIAEGATVNAT